MNEKQKAKDLVHQFRMLLMDEGEDYGEEILVSILSKKMALILVEERLTPLVIEDKTIFNGIGLNFYWQDVKTEIEKL